MNYVFCYVDTDTSPSIYAYNKFTGGLYYIGMISEGDLAETNLPYARDVKGIIH
ncbi:hypothetical protein [Vibrio phage BONAISHI]|nr:hypothetical protein [Vibrio phage BONAISHI]